MNSGGQRPGTYKNELDKIVWDDGFNAGCLMGLILSAAIVGMLIGLVWMVREVLWGWA